MSKKFGKNILLSESESESESELEIELTKKDTENEKNFFLNLDRNSTNGKIYEQYLKFINKKTNSNFKKFYKNKNPELNYVINKFNEYINEQDIIKKKEIEIQDQNKYKSYILEKDFLDDQIILLNSLSFTQKEKDDILLENYKKFIKDVKYFRNKFKNDPPTIQYIKNRLREYDNYVLNIDDISKKENFLKALEIEKNPIKLMEIFKTYINEDPNLQIKFKGKEISVEYIKFLITNYLNKKDSEIEIQQIENILSFINKLPNNIDRIELVRKINEFINSSKTSEQSKDILNKLISSELTIDKIKKLNRNYINENNLNYEKYENYIDKYVTDFKSNPEHFKEEEQVKDIFIKIKEYTYDDNELLKFIIKKILKHLPNENEIKLLNDKIREYSEKYRKIIQELMELAPKNIDELINIDKKKEDELVFEKTKTLNQINLLEKKIIELENKDQKFIFNYILFGDTDNIEENIDVPENIRNILKDIISLPVNLIRKLIREYNNQYIQDNIKNTISIISINPVINSAYELFYNDKLMSKIDDKSYIIKDENIEKKWREHQNFQNINEDGNYSYGDDIYNKYSKMAENYNLNKKDNEPTLSAYELFYKDNTTLKNDKKILDKLNISFRREIINDWENHRKLNDEIYKSYIKKSDKSKGVIEILDLKDFYNQFINSPENIKYKSKGKIPSTIENQKMERETMAKYDERQKEIIEGSKMVAFDKTNEKKYKDIEYIKKFDFVSNTFIDTTVKTPKIDMSLSYTTLKQKQENVKKRLVKLSRISKGPITENIKKIAINTLSKELLKIANVSEYKKDSEYIKNVIDLISEKTNNVEEFSIILFNIIVYLYDEINSIIVFKYKDQKQLKYVSNRIYINNIEIIFYLPNMLVELSPNEKLPDLFENKNIRSETKIEILSKINYFIIQKANDFIKEVFMLENIDEIFKEEPKILINQIILNEPYEMVTFEKEDKDGNIYYVYYNEYYNEQKIYNNDIIEIPKNKIFKFKAEDMMDILNNDGINPYSGLKIDSEFAEKFKMLYSKKIKNITEDVLDISNIIIPNFLDEINMELTLIEKNQFDTREQDIEKSKELKELEFMKIEEEHQKLIEQIQKEKQLEEIGVMEMEDINIEYAIKDKKYTVIFYLVNIIIEHMFILLINNTTGELGYVYDYESNVLLSANNEFLNKNLITSGSNIDNQLKEFQKQNEFNIYLYILLKKGRFIPIDNKELNFIVKDINFRINNNFMKRKYKDVEHDEIESFQSAINNHINSSSLEDIKNIKMVFNDNHAPTIVFDKDNKYETVKITEYKKEYVEPVQDIKEYSPVDEIESTETKKVEIGNDLVENKKVEVIIEPSKDYIGFMYDKYLEKEWNELYIEKDINNIQLTYEQKDIIKKLKNTNKDISNADILKILKNEEEKQATENEKIKYYLNKLEEYSKNDENVKYFIDFIKNKFFTGKNTYTKDILQLLDEKHVLSYQVIYEIVTMNKSLEYIVANIEDDKKTYDFIVKIISDISNKKMIIKNDIDKTIEKIKRLTLDKENLIKKYSENKDDKQFATDINIIDKQLKINKEILEYYQTLDKDEAEIKKNTDPRFKILAEKDKYFVILRKDGLYISSVYNIENKKFLDKDDIETKNIIYPRIIENKDDIPGQLEKYLKENGDNIYASIYLNKKKLIHSFKKDIEKYINIIKNENPQLDIEKYINNVEESVCLNDIDNIKVYFEDDNMPIFKYNDKDVIQDKDIDCLDKYDYDTNTEDISKNVTNEEYLEKIKKGEYKYQMVKKPSIGIVSNNKNYDTDTEAEAHISENYDKDYGSSSDSGDSIYASDNEHIYDEFKCFKCKNTPPDKSIKTIILNNKNIPKTIYFCCFTCFENEDKAFKKYK